MKIFPVMNKRYGLRVAAYVSVFAGAWWLGSLRDSGPQAGSAAAGQAALQITSKGNGTTAKAGAAQTTDSTEVAGLAGLEGKLLQLIKKENRTYDGEGLLAALAKPFATELPGLPEFTAYATLWAESDPEGMFSWFQKRGSFEIRFGAGSGLEGGNARFLENLFGGWARVDPDRSAQAALECIKAGDRAPALAAVIVAIRAQDPGKASALMRSNMGILGESQANLFSAYGPEAVANFALIQSLPDAAVKNKLLAGYLEQAVRYQKEKIGGFWESLPVQTRREVVAAGFQGDRLNSRNIQESKAGGSTELSGLRELLYEKADAGKAEDVAVYLNYYGQSWARAEPAAALTWAQDRLRGKERMDKMPTLYAAAAAGNLDAAMEVWEALPPGLLKANAFGGIAAGAPAERLAEVEAVIAGMSAEDQKDAADVRGRVSSKRKAN